MQTMEICDENDKVKSASPWLPDCLQQYSVFWYRKQRWWPGSAPVRVLPDEYLKGKGSRKLSRPGRDYYEPLF